VVQLGAPIPTPPPNVPALEESASDDSHPQTLRAQMEMHVSRPFCSGCHKIMDPIGLGLENFDGSGSFRATENGVQIDASGTLDGVDFKDALGLAEALRDNPALPECLVQRLYHYSVGGPPAAESQHRAFLDYVNEEFALDEYRLRDLLRTIALSDAFTRIEEPLSPDPAGQVPGGNELQTAVPPDGNRQGLALRE